MALLILAILVQWCWNKLDQKDNDDVVVADDFMKIADPETTQTTADSSPTIQKRSVATSDTTSTADEDTGEVKKAFQLYNIH